MRVSTKTQSPASSSSCKPPAANCRRPFNHVDQAARLPAVRAGEAFGRAGGHLDHLCLQARRIAGGIQRNGPHRLGAARGAFQVSFARDREDVVIRLGEEVAHAHSIHAADGRQRGQRGNHPVGFKFGKQRGGQARLGRKPRQREPLLGAQSAKFPADAIWFKRPLRIRIWVATYSFSLGFEAATNKPADSGRILEVFLHQ